MKCQSEASGRPHYALHSAVAVTHLPHHHRKRVHISLASWHRTDESERFWIMDLRRHPTQRGREITHLSGGVYCMAVVHHG